ncbi:MAG TPA: hypothetical protein VGR91_01410 [Stellaceae bacterium]|nr:hypothetical protein [Stellaceae bacterium]
MMRPLLPLLCVVLLLAGCTHATATRVDANTFTIHGPGIPGGSDAPNVRLAKEICPNGFRVLKSTTLHNTPNGSEDRPGNDFTNWMIRCI